MYNQDEEDDLEQGMSAIDEPAPLQDIYVYIAREHDEEALQVIDSAAPGAPERAQDTPTHDQKPTISRKESAVIAWCILSLAAILPLASLLFQCYLILHPFTATIAIIPKSQQIFFNGTVQLGRMLAPTTLRQSQTVKTTGKGHQDAKQAQGTITLYNGLFTSQMIAAGTVLTGSDGVQIVTDQEAHIPAANPPSFGYTTVSAHALYSGSKGNIGAYDISYACCSTAIKAVNTTSFYGGADERDFQTVSQADIHTTATLLKTHLTEELTTALQKQMKNGEVMIAPPCTPTVRSDHQPGEEAKQVTVSVSEMCNSAAYKTKELQKDATLLLNSQALQKLGAGYSLIGNVQIMVKQATITGTHINLEFFSLGTYTYKLSTKAQERIKKLIAGKTTQEAMQLLLALPGIKSAVIHFDENTKLPKDPRNIQLVVMYAVFQYHSVS